MNGLFQYPKNTLFNKTVSKSKIMAHSRPSGPVKQQLTDQVSQIFWKHKLFPNALNLSASVEVPEIQIFEVLLKGDEIAEDVLRLIDRAIPFPIIFELRRDRQICVAGAYKRPSEADTTKWVISDYMRSQWLPEETSRSALPVALNLGVLYEQLLTALMPIVPQKGEGMTAKIKRSHELKTKQREVNRLESQLNRETQFNIKMTLHGELREAQADFEYLKKPE